ncbi:MAG: aminodeoxychorismate synthase component I [Rhizomicrobium sp.]|jgi:para-aminobenzoate synthetase/4-amino-4-deoxychorismate lyase
MSASPPRLILDDPVHAGLRVFDSPIGIVEARDPADVPRALAQIDHAVRAGRYVAGYFSYELGYALERKLAHHLWPERSIPLLWFGIFESCEHADVPATGARAYAGPLRHEWDERAYGERFAGAHALIAAGDFYQVNLTFRSRFAFAGEPLALYRELRAASRASHCAYVDDGERQILSLSPELFFDLSSSRILTVRPMKGTAPRGSDAQSDAAARAALLASEKDRAENLMIVDLLRNDLGRIAEIGSVETGQLFEIETYPTLHQMVSSITATLKRGQSVGDIVHALFPCGSVTGAPKIRAMEAIREMEAGPRGAYCGAIGHFAPDGSAHFNVAIRTITIQGGRGELGIGGAVTHDSHSADEYRECLLKALYYERARRPLELIETLRHSAGAGFVRIAQHLARMARSAGVFGIAFDEGAARDALDKAVAGSATNMRVRLTLAENGAFACTAVPVVGSPQRLTYVLSPQKTNSGDVLLRHKTNWRDLYDTEQRHAALECGADEILFVNERGELTEGSRTNLFVEKAGRLLTPALACGVLDGCLRQALIAEGRCIEAVLTPDDLARADIAYLGNSLRGLVRAEAVAQAHAT